MIWATVDRPGYLGISRNRLYALWNLKFGREEWRIAWQWGKKIIERPEALQLYEDSYYEFFKAKPLVLDWLVNFALDVYDTAPSNIEAKFSYNHQETSRNHIHDVAIRRAVLRRGKWFEGKRLLEVGSTNTEGEILSPCNIPFHLSYMIYQGQTKYKGEERDFDKNPPWWRTIGVSNSVEEFYQSNKVLQVLQSRE
jgi:hypothetical protein